MDAATAFFTNPLLLWFLPLAAIPVVLHLLTLHRLKTVELSTFRFLFDSYIQQRRRMKFLEWLIAALRTLFLLFLIFAISRARVPDYWQALFGGGAGGRDVVLMIDASASMRAATGGQTAIDRAREAAKKVVEGLRPGDRVTVIKVVEQPEQVLSRFTADTKSILAEIDNIQVGSSRGNLYAAFSQLYGGKSAELSKLDAPLVYLFSDLQQSGWREFGLGQTTVKAAPGSELKIVNVGSGRPLPNRAVVGDAPAQARAIVGLPVTLRPRVANLSRLTSTDPDFAVTVTINSQRVDRQLVTVRPGEEQQLEVIYTPTEPGVLRGQFEIPGDAFTDDDVFRFALAVQPQVRVLLVNGNPSAEPRENDGLYLNAALSATDAAADDDPEAGSPPGQPPVEDLGPGRDFVRSLAVQEIPEAGLNDDVLAETAVVILANCGGLSPDHFRRLRNFVEGGGGLIILPGDKVNPETYTKQFFPDPNDPERKLVSAELGAATGDLDKAETFVGFGAVDYAHPVLSVFARNRSPYFTRVNIYRRFALLLLPEQRGSTWPLVRFTEADTPAMVESRFGVGRVLLSAFPFHARWGNLPLRPEFVPLVLRMVAHVMRPPSLDGPSVVAAGGTAEFIADAAWFPVSATVTDARRRITPLEEFQRSRGQLIGAFDRTLAQGFYEVKVTGGTTAKPVEGQLAFAVNLAEGESDFTPLGGTAEGAGQSDPAKRLEQIELRVARMLPGLVPNETLQAFDASADARQKYGEPGRQREIWRWLIFLIFLIIGVEFLLSTLSGQLADDEEAPGTAERIRQMSPGSWVGRMTGSNVTEAGVETPEQSK